MDYPGRNIKMGEADAGIVRALKIQLNEVLVLDDDLRLDPRDPNFGPKMKKVVMLFQARHVDASGRPLKQDGVVGAITWSALFDDSTVPEDASAPTEFLTGVLQTASAEEAKHVREVPRNSNCGPAVEGYLRSVGLEPGKAWCCAFVYWCFDEAARSRARPNPMVRTGGCLDHWNRAPSAGASRILRNNAIQDPSTVQAGMIFVIDHGQGLGHTGLVEQAHGGLLTTIEGNTDASKTREGGGVYRLNRTVNEINKGFIDYSALTV